MALSIITDKFRIENAKKFVQSVKQRIYPADFSTTTTDYETAKSAVLNSQADRLYMMVGKVTTWYDPNVLPAGIADADAVPAITDDLRSESEVWSNAQFVKQVTSTHVRHVIPRQNWVTGVVYPFYQSNSSNTTTYSSSTTENFYVLDEAEYRVYKCLWNNYGSNSTVKPTQIGGGSHAKRIQREPFETTDGYIWKYMYTIAASDVTNFVTDNFIPVEKDDTNTPNTTADGGVYKIYLTDAAKGTYATYAVGGAGTPAGNVDTPGSEVFSRTKLTSPVLKQPGDADTVTTGVSNKLAFTTTNVATDAANDLVGYQIERIITTTGTSTGGEIFEIAEITASTTAGVLTGLKRLDSAANVILTHATQGNYDAGDIINGKTSGARGTCVNSEITSGSVANAVTTVTVDPVYGKFLDGETIREGISGTTNEAVVSSVEYGFSKLAAGKEERFFIAPLIEIEGEGENASAVMRLVGEDSDYDTAAGRHYPTTSTSVNANALDIVINSNGTGYRNVDERHDTDGTLNSHANVKTGEAKIGTSLSGNTGGAVADATIIVGSNARKMINFVRMVSATPYGGHSYDNVAELYGYTIMINQNFVGTESGAADVTNDFRQIALVQNPLEQAATAGSETIADQAMFTNYVRVEFNGDVTSTVQVDDEISNKSAANVDKTVVGRVVSTQYISGTDGGSSNATRVLLSSTSGFMERDYADIYHLNDSNYLWLSDDVSANTNPYTALTLSTAFGTNLVDGNSDKIYYRGLDSSASTVSQGLKPLTGEIMYMENRAPISRATDQTENVKLIIEY